VPRVRAQEPADPRAPAGHPRFTYTSESQTVGTNFTKLRPGGTLFECNAQHFSGLGGKKLTRG
jgi:hypothetical protein